MRERDYGRGGGPFELSRPRAKETGDADTVTSAVELTQGVSPCQVEVPLPARADAASKVQGSHLSSQCSHLSSSYVHFKMHDCLYESACHRKSVPPQPHKK